MAQNGSEDFGRFRGELLGMGFARKTTAIILGECALFVLLNVAGIALVVTMSSWLAKAAGMVLVASGSMGLTTNGHTASHHAISKRKWINEFIMYFDYAFCLGLSGNYWKNKHITVHHASPNIVGIDGDADLMPIFTLNSRDVAEATGFRRWWYERQGYFLPVVLAGNAFGVAFKGWRFLLRELADPARRNRTTWIDLACVLAHVVVWIVIPVLVFGAADALAFYLVRMVMISYVSFALFAPAHYPDECIQITKDATRDNYLMLQTATAVNFKTGPIGRLLCGGVDYQLEHHLFPWISPRHYPRLSPMLRAFCEQNGYPYRAQGWWVAIWKSYLTFWRPKDIYDSFPEHVYGSGARSGPSDAPSGGELEGGNVRSVALGV